MRYYNISKFIIAKNAQLLRYSNMYIWPLFYSVPKFFSIEDTDY